MVLRSPGASRRQAARVAGMLARVGLLMAVVVYGAHAAATLTHSARHMAVEEGR